MIELAGILIVILVVWLFQQTSRLMFQVAYYKHKCALGGIDTSSVDNMVWWKIWLN